MDLKTPAESVLKRAVRNAGKLLSGKVGAGLMQLGTFALAARALGASEFGLFSVLIAQVMLFAGLASFESSQAIIRYGVPHLNDLNKRAAQSLFKAGMLLDLGAAALAALAMVAAAPLLANWIGWNERLVHLAQAIAPLTFAGAIGTSKGMLRLFDRYDLLSWHALVTPGARLLMIAVCAALDLSLGFYLAAWVVAGWLGMLAAAFLGWREAHRRDMLTGMTGSLRNLAHDQPGMWRFALFANLNASVGLVPSHLATLVVAAILGTESAGAYRIAREVAAGLLKPVDLVNQAIYPDLARLVLARNWSGLWRTAARGGMNAAIIFSVITAFIALVGHALLTGIFGPEIAVAAPLLIAIGVATTIKVTVFAAEPVLYAVGRPDVLFALSLVTGALFVGILFWRLPIDGLSGAGWSFIGMDGVFALLSALIAIHIVRRRAAEVSESNLQEMS